MDFTQMFLIRFLNTFDSDDVSGRKQKSIHPGTEASRDVFF